ncbi:MAG: hypothetical protein QM808_09185 [Steroidobacteraceae bacterium]
MRSLILALALTTILAACQSTPSQQTSVAENEGSSPKLAVDLSKAKTESDGIRAERTWIKQHYPGATVKSQALLMGPPVMDLLVISLPSGEERSIYFDISSFFGKL